MQTSKVKATRIANSIVQKAPGEALYCHLCYWVTSSNMNCAKHVRRTWLSRHMDIWSESPLTLLTLPNTLLGKPVICHREGMAEACQERTGTPPWGSSMRARRWQNPRCWWATCLTALDGNPKDASSIPSPAVFSITSFVMQKPEICSPVFVTNIYMIIMYSCRKNLSLRTGKYKDINW